MSNISGARLETYVISGARDSGEICMNGSAAYLIGVGEEIIVMGFELVAESIAPRIVLVDRTNRIVRHLIEDCALVVA